MDLRAARRPRWDWDRLGMAAALVVILAFALLRLLSVAPWSWPMYDLWAYWLSHEGLDYASARPGDTGAYLYSPAFAQAISILTALPWPTFAAARTALAAAPIAWLAGRWALPLLALPPLVMTVALGQLDLAFAAVALLGLRWPAAWVLPILTKVSPVVCLVWYAARGEWSRLAIAAGATAGLAAASAAIDPAAWSSWLALLVRLEFPVLDGRLIFLPVPLWIRLPAVVALVAWGAARDRPWALPVGLALSLPTVWLNAPTILVAVVPFIAAGSTSPAGRWLRTNGLLGAQARGREPRGVREAGAA